MFVQQLFAAMSQHVVVCVRDAWSFICGSTLSGALRRQRPRGDNAKAELDRRLLELALASSSPPNQALAHDHSRLSHQRCTCFLQQPDKMAEKMDIDTSNGEKQEETVNRVADLPPERST